MYNYTVYILEDKEEIEINASTKRQSITNERKNDFIYKSINEIYDNIEYKNQMLLEISNMLIKYKNTNNNKDIPGCIYIYIKKGEESALLAIINKDMLDTFPHIKSAEMLLIKSIPIRTIRQKCMINFISSIQKFAEDRYI